MRRIHECFEHSLAGLACVDCTRRPHMRISTGEGENSGQLGPVNSERSSFASFYGESKRKLAVEKELAPQQVGRILKEMNSLDHQQSLIQRTAEPLQELLAIMRASNQARSAALLQQLF